MRKKKKRPKNVKKEKRNPLKKKKKTVKNGQIVKVNYQ